jgi:uncharacterized UBP type Zn finger protein
VTVKQGACKHIAESYLFAEPKARTPKCANVCSDCVALGDTWVHLRLCLTCGHVGCCDESKNKHATAHFHATQHPVIRSFEPDETWRWCYVDETVSDLPGRKLPGSVPEAVATV